GTRCSITPPRSPKANAICERLNGTLRRDCLDHIIVIDEVHADRVLKDYVRYYHGRPHRGLRMQPPLGARWLAPVRRVPPKDVVSRPILGGLHHEYHARVARFVRPLPAPARSHADPGALRPKSGAAHPSPRAILGAVFGELGPRSA